MIYVDLFAEIVAKTSARILPKLVAFDNTITGVNYYHGPPLQVEAQLQEWTMTDARKKYPVVALIEPLREQHGKIVGVDGIPRVQLIIGRQSEQDWLTPKRYDVNFRPVLQPIYETMLDIIEEDDRFETQDSSLIEHDKTNWPFWTNGKDTNPFKDKLDVIEVNFTNLIIKQKNCN